jgi:hypothetical protein
MVLTAKISDSAKVCLHRGFKACLSMLKPFQYITEPASAGTSV